MVLTDGKFYFSLDDDDNTAGNPDDLTGNGNNGVTTGATTGVTGILNEGYDFSGITNYINIGSNMITGPIVSIGMWVNPDFAWVDGINRVFYDSSTFQYLLQKDSGGNLQIFAGGSVVNAYTSVPGWWSTTNWIHIVVVTNATANTYKLYIDGNLDKSGTLTHSQSAPSNFRIGAYAHFGTAGEFDGAMDEIGLWNRELLSGEVTTLFNSGNAFNPFAATGYTNKSIGVTTPSEITGKPVADIGKFIGV